MLERRCAALQRCRCPPQECKKVRWPVSLVIAPDGLGLQAPRNCVILRASFPPLPPEAFGCVVMNRHRLRMDPNRKNKKTALHLSIWSSSMPVPTVVHTLMNAQTRCRPSAGKSAAASVKGNLDLGFRVVRRACTFSQQSLYHSTLSGRLL